MVHIDELRIEDDDRCPGCGNLIVRKDGEVIGRNFCYPLTVDSTQPGYRYLTGVWGYCYTLSRDIKNDEQVWVDKFIHWVCGL